MADLFDNADDAGASELRISVLEGSDALPMESWEPRERILVQDNGPGMKREQALKCASLAYTKPADGRLGMVSSRRRADTAPCV